MEDILRNIWRLSISCCFFVNRILLRAKGVKISSSANVHWTAVIEPNGGIININSKTYIDRGVIIRAYGGFVTIGENCTINAYSVLYGDGGLSIGNGVRIASHVVIVPANHIFIDKKKPIFKQGQSCQGISIEDDVWIGAGVTILDGSTICKGCVVGAGSVVTKNTESYGIYTGVPAEKKRERI